MRLRLLGGLDLAAAPEAPAHEVTRQIRLILACLALAGAKGLTRAELCALFWPERASAQARNSLRQGLAAIRKALARDADDAGAMSLKSDLEVVRLSPRPEAIDVHALQHGVQSDNRDGWIAAA